MLKKIIVLSLSVLILWSCEEETLSVQEPAINNSGIISFTTENQSPLRSHQEFMSYYNRVLSDLNKSKAELISDVNLKNIKKVEGMLAISNIEEFNQLYETLETKNENWQSLYDEKIDLLLDYASSKTEILKKLGSIEEIEYEIQDLLEEDDYFDYDFQKSIAQKMPMNTLWNKATTLEEQWLKNSGETLDLESAPQNEFFGDDIMQLFLNESSKINVLGTVRDFTEENTTGKRSKALSRNGACVTHGRATAQGESGNKRIWVKVNVRNFFVVKTMKAKIKGYKKRGRRWKHRRFNKELFLRGYVIAHNTSGLDDNCDPIFREHVSVSKKKKKRTFSVKMPNYWIGNNRYIAACSGEFGASGYIENNRTVDAEAIIR